MENQRQSLKTPRHPLCEESDDLFPEITAV